MKGWVTVDPKQAVEVVQRHAFFKVLDDEDLVVELEREEDLARLAEDLEDAFGDQLHVERM
jgi:hypothetical protein